MGMSPATWLEVAQYRTRKHLYSIAPDATRQMVAQCPDN